TILDMERSDIRYYPNGWLRQFRTTHKRLYFLEEELDGLPPIFRLNDRYGAILVTEEFVDIVERDRLTGMSCDLVWPQSDPEVERQKYLEKRRRKKKPQRKA
ncbi:MAG: imm11 family protein, partial [Aeoliella sp.]